MDLEYGNKYDSFREEVRHFIETNKERAPADWDFSDRARVVIWQKLLIENGFLGRTIPRKYGGCGAEPDILEARIISDEFAKSQIPRGVNVQGIAYLVPVLLDMGTEEQKERFIPPTLTAEMLWCEGYSEPNAGSDLASLKTSAVLDGDEWVVNGQKIWTSTAEQADWIFCLARTEPEAPKHKGISFLLFSMKSPGVDVVPLKTMSGTHQFNEVFFKDVRVPKDQIVGKRGEGWKVANRVLDYEREDLGDPNLTLQRLHLLIDLMQNEMVNGKRLIDFPVYRDRLMKFQAEVMALRFNDLRLLSAKLHRKDATLASMIVKLQGTELRHELEGFAIDVLGEHGLLYGDAPYLQDDGSWQANYMFHLGLIIGGGTAQIQKNIISERALGMPREPKVAS